MSYYHLHHLALVPRPLHSSPHPGTDTIPVELELGEIFGAFQHVNRIKLRAKKLTAEV